MHDMPRKCMPCGSVCIRSPWSDRCMTYGWDYACHINLLCPQPTPVTIAWIDFSSSQCLHGSSILKGRGMHYSWVSFSTLLPQVYLQQRCYSDQRLETLLEKLNSCNINLPVISTFSGHGCPEMLCRNGPLPAYIACWHALIDAVSVVHSSFFLVYSAMTR